MLGLGNSVGTPPDGVEGEVLVVHSFEELDAAGARVHGQDRPLQRAVHELRRNGAVPLGWPVTRRGARARSPRWFAPSVRRDCARRTPARCAIPTGQPQIPAAAVTHRGCRRLQRMQDRGTPARVRLRMEAQFLPDADSSNVVGEIRGRELPDEVVVVGGHIDSWDVGTGSTDDGGGCVVTWEALRLMKKLNLRPRRTVRVVLWTNEENGTRGGRLPRSLPGPAREPRADAGVRQRRVPADRLRLHRQRRRPRARHRDRDAAARHPGGQDQRRRRGRRHRSERRGRTHARRCRSTWTATTS